MIDDVEQVAAQRHAVGQHQLGPVDVGQCGELGFHHAPDLRDPAQSEAPDRSGRRSLKLKCASHAADGNQF